MTFALGPRAAEAGYRIAAYDSIGSTNAEAMARARAGDRGPLWIVAKAQSRGRGRRGRAWSTERGNLAATLLIHTRAPAAVAATLGFVAGLALTEALDALAPGLDVGLKWPNDVLARGEKLAGILLESEPIADGAAVVVGIGVNVVDAPHGLPYPAVSLAGLGIRMPPERLFAALSEGWIGLHRLWNEGRGLPQIRRHWLARAAGLGERVAVRAGEGVIAGTFETLDDEGRMIVRTADGRAVPVAAGDVYFGHAATLHETVRENG